MINDHCYLWAFQVPTDTVNLTLQPRRRKQAVKSSTAQHAHNYELSVIGKKKKEKSFPYITQTYIKTFKILKPFFFLVFFPASCPLHVCARTHMHTQPVLYFLVIQNQSLTLLNLTSYFSSYKGQSGLLIPLSKYMIDFSFPLLYFPCHIISILEAPNSLLILKACNFFISLCPFF